MANLLSDVVSGVLAINSRSGFGLRVTYSVVYSVVYVLASVLANVGTGVHSVIEIDPDDPEKIPFLLAFE